jgi:hypothetical protein
LEGGERTEVQEGTPQGATISPLLANVFLHYALDLWVRRWRDRGANGDVVIVRYCDDFIVGFQRHEDAVRFLADLRKRMEQFGLELHPEKTRLIPFGRYAAERRRERGLKGHPETFNFLGFTHICGKTSQGKFLLMRRTIRQRMSAKLKEVHRELLRRRHLPIPVQGRWLGQVVRGYFAYYSVPTNIHSMQAFRTQVERHWRHALTRRSQRGRPNWERMRRLSARWIPSPRILHPWPADRFDVTHPR